MDKEALGKEVAEEVTRESLIAISYCEPDNFYASKSSSEKVNGESLIRGIDGDAEDKFRSELISISYTQSPDIKVLPVGVAGGELKK
ncbi:hypothetical protein FNV43_RR12770 [Rhamnella rubrinervis]|uniref:Uncharacterized protein n=1 Tax=Rhamnella rubrinervis TaxID=2594499 RepID=A0A8K0H912_9ROSA|nr:hypothetical protein FNV43_RR12770 [Rhamnella rubrinervis]